MRILTRTSGRVALASDARAEPHDRLGARAPRLRRPGRAARSFLEAAEHARPGRVRGHRRGGRRRACATSPRGSAIAVHGDYDVDGVCSTAVLACGAARARRGRSHARLPSRDEGYGLSRRARRGAARAPARALLITTDCGITAVAEVERAPRARDGRGRHRPSPPGRGAARLSGRAPGGRRLSRPTCARRASPTSSRRRCLRAAGRDPAELERELDIVALATVADLVPLVGENRALVKQRPARDRRGPSRPGLRALLRVAGVDPQSVTEQTLGFALAPRINAAGRLYRADAALELMLTADEDRALEIARELDAINTERQSVETAILFEAERQLAELGATGSGGAADPLYVLAQEGWHPGVIGIVASRLVERYHRPFVMVAMVGVGRRAAARVAASRPYDLHAGLAACAEHLDGLRRSPDGRRAAGARPSGSTASAPRWSRTRARRLTAEDLVKVERVDAVVPGDALGLDLAEELQALRPFGMGNPGVNVLVPAARVVGRAADGRGPPRALHRHLRAALRSRAVGFGIGAAARRGLRDGDTAPRPRRAARGERVAGRGRAAPRGALAALARAPRSARCGRLPLVRVPERRRRMVERGVGAHTSGAEPASAPTCRPAPTRTVVDRRGAGRARRARRPDDDRRVRCCVVCADVSRRAAAARARPRARRASGARRGRSSSRALRPAAAERAAPERSSCCATTRRSARDPAPAGALQRTCSRSTRRRSPSRSRIAAPQRPSGGRASCISAGARRRSSSRARVARARACAAPAPRPRSTARWQGLGPPERRDPAGRARGRRAPSAPARAGRPLPAGAGRARSREFRALKRYR